MDRRPQVVLVIQVVVALHANVMVKVLALLNLHALTIVQQINVQVLVIRFVLILMVMVVKN
jgi:hypothetical protein